MGAYEIGPQKHFQYRVNIEMLENRTANELAWEKALCYYERIIILCHNTHISSHIMSGKKK